MEHNGSNSSDQVEENISPQASFEKILKSQGKLKEWVNHKKIGLVQHHKLEEYLKGIDVEPTNLKLTSEERNEVFYKKLMELTESDIPEDDAVIQIEALKLKLQRENDIINYFREVKKMKSFRVYNRGSFQPNSGELNSKKDIIENLKLLKNGAGLLTQFVKSPKMLKNNFLIYQDFEKGIDNTKQRRRNYQYLMQHNKMNQEDEKLAMYRDSAFYSISREQLKSSFTCQVKVVSGELDKARGLEFEIDLSILKVREILRKITDILRKKFIFATPVFLYENVYETKLVKSQSTLVNYANEVSLNREQLTIFTKTPSSILSSLVEPTSKFEVEHNLNSEAPHDIFVKDNSKKNIYIWEDSQEFRLSSNRVLFMEHFINQTLTVYLTRPDKVQVLKSFDSLKLSLLKAPRLIETIRPSHNIRIHGFAIYTRKYTGYQEHPMTVALTVRSIRTDLESEGSLEMRGIQKAGVKKIWLISSFELKNSEKAQVIIEQRLNYNEASGQFDKIKKGLVLEINRTGQNMRKEDKKVNGLEINFSDNSSHKFICAVYYTLS